MLRPESACGGRLGDMQRKTGRSGRPERLAARPSRWTTRGLGSSGESANEGASGARLDSPATVAIVVGVNPSPRKVEK